MTSQLLTVDRTKLHSNPNNPRGALGSLTALTASIKERGIIQSLVAYPDPEREGHYVLKAGHRRLAAAEAAGLTEVPVTVIDADDAKGDVQDALVENIVREGLSPVDKARGIQTLFDLGMSATAIGKPIGMKAKDVKRHQGLAAAQADVQDAVGANALTLDEALAMADFAEFPELTARVLEAAGKGHNVTYEIERARRAAIVATVRAEVEANGNRFLDDDEWNWSRHVEVKQLDKSAQKQHDKLPCHATSVRTEWEGNDRVPVAVSVCTDRASHDPGHKPASDSAGPTADAAKEAETEARRAVIRLNKDWTVANEVRTEWIAQFKARKRFDKAALGYAAGVIARQGSGRMISASSVYADMVGAESRYTAAVETAEAELADASAATRFLVWLALSVAEEGVDKSVWRNGGNTFAAHLRGLVTLGYTPSEPEATWLAEKAQKVTQ